ncbi:MAG: phenylacetate-CoA oxygenase/reductase subunit PaaK [Marmoricola sp.]|nr:phenylacetate-CoA oxygenase/reductase subunit PaaK [Marmoricola sp.]
MTVASVERLCDDAVAVTFDVPEELRAAYDFEAGQSLTLRRVLDGEDHRRDYSICSRVGERPRVGVRLIPGGRFSEWLVNEVRPGDEVEVQTPRGSFRARPDGGRHLLIAAGSGITPMISIASTVLTHPDSRVTLLYGNRTTGSVMFVEEIADLKNRYGARFEVVHVLSREPRDVELFSGRLDGDRLRQLLRLLVPLESVDHVWLCGPFAMIADARDVLAELGVDPARVHAELFFVDEPPPVLRRSDAVPSGATSAVTVVLDGRSTTNPQPRDQTLLDGAQKTRADLPFACKGGVCGTCRALLVTGEGEMRRNYALDADEVERGFVLTCQTLPVSEELTIDFDA